MTKTKTEWERNREREREREREGGWEIFSCSFDHEYLLSSQSHRWVLVIRNYTDLERRWSEWTYIHWWYYEWKRNKTKRFSFIWRKVRDDKNAFFNLIFFSLPSFFIVAFVLFFSFHTNKWIFFLLIFSACNYYLYCLFYIIYPSSITLSVLLYLLLLLILSLLSSLFVLLLLLYDGLNYIPNFPYFRYYELLYAKFPLF